MKKYKNYIIICLIFIIALYCTIKVYTVQNYNNGNNSSKIVLENAIKAENKKDLDSLLNYYTSDTKEESFNLDNLNFKYITNIELINKESNLYNVYLTYGKGKTLKVNKNNLRIYTVTYYIQYNDEEASHDTNGSKTQKYYLIKENNNWKISSIGD